MKFPHPAANRRVLALALPTMMALAAEPLFGLVDTAFIARLGTRQLASLALASTIIGVVTWVFNFLFTGTTASVAEALGRKSDDEARQIVFSTGRLAWQVGLLAAMVCLLLEKYLFSWLGDPGPLRETGALYYRLRLLSLPLVLSYFVVMGALRGMQKMKIPMRITVGATLVNLLLDPLLIFGVPGLWRGCGLAGAGIATLLAQCGAWGAFRLALRKEKPSWFVVQKPIKSVPVVLKITAINRDLFLRTVFLLGSLAFATSLVTRCGEISLAAHQVAMQLWLFFSFTVDGFAVTGQALAGDLAGRGRLRALCQYGNLLQRWGAGFGLSFAIVLLASGRWLRPLMLPDPAAQSLLTEVYPLLLLMQPLNGVTFVLDGIHIGRLDTGFLRWQLFIAGPCCFVPVSWWLVQSGYGLYGVWLGLTLFLIVRYVFNYLRWLNVCKSGGHR